MACVYLDGESYAVAHYFMSYLYINEIAVIYLVDWASNR
jgi:hypothetical protein